MDIIFIIFHRYVISCNYMMNKCDRHFFFYIEKSSILSTCMVNYLIWLLMILNSFAFIAVIRYFIIYTKNWLCIYYFKKMSVLNGLWFWTLLCGRFEVTITLSLFDIFKLFDLFLFAYNIAVVHLLFLGCTKYSYLNSFLTT